MRVSVKVDIQCDNDLEKLILDTSLSYAAESIIAELEFDRDKIRQDIADFAAKLISEQLELNSKKGDSNG